MIGKELQHIEKLPFFFIVGRPRSGTTMLRMVLDAHPNVLVPPECPLLLRLFNKYRKVKVWNQETKEQFIQDLFHQRKFEYWDIPREKLEEEINALPGNTSLQAIFKLVYYRYTSPFDKEDIRMLGDKNPVYSMPVKRVAKIFPDAKFIYITRDYRDHILSMLRVKLLLPDVIFLAFRWRQSVKNVLKLRKKQPEKFYSFRYEDFVQNPEPFTQGICDHLGLPFYPAMLKYYEKEDEIKLKYPKEQFELFFSNLFKPINPERIFLWKKQMSEKNIKTIDMVVGMYATISGYEKKYNFELLFYLKILPEISRQYFLQSLRIIFRKTPKGLKRLLKMEETKFAKLVKRTS